MTKTEWPSKPEIFIVWFLKEKKLFIPALEFTNLRTVFLPLGYPQMKFTSSTNSHVPTLDK